jgi:hypothetical protein
LISDGKQKASFLLSIKVNHLRDRFWLAHPCAKRDMPIKRIDQHVPKPVFIQTKYTKALYIRRLFGGRIASVELSAARMVAESSFGVFCLREMRRRKMYGSTAADSYPPQSV